MNQCSSHSKSRIETLMFLQLTDTLALVTSVGDLYPRLFRGGKYRKMIAMAIGCLCLYLVGLTMVTQVSVPSLVVTVALIRTSPWLASSLLDAAIA